MSLKDKITLLQEASRRLKADEQIVDWQSSMSIRQSEVLLVNGAGGHIEQTELIPSEEATVEGIPSVKVAWSNSTQWDFQTRLSA